jgi:hypothetical protein
MPRDIPVGNGDLLITFDRLYRIRVTLTTASGQRLSDERDVMPRPGMYPPSPCGS